MTATELLQQRVINRTQRVVLISQPVHQHGYETAVAAQQKRLLRCFATGIYYTGRGPMSPDLLRRLPAGLRTKVVNELSRRHHPELEPTLVYTVPLYHAFATAVRRAADSAQLPGAFDLDTWAHLRFDESVGRLLPQLEGIRIVHAFEGSGLATLRAAKRLGLTTILDVTSAQEHLQALGLESNPRISLSWIRAERDAADFLFAPSDYVIRCLTDHGVSPEKIRKIPYGVDHVRFSPAVGSRSDEGRFRVLYAGGIVPRKGLRYLLEAWRALALPHAELVLVGRPDKAGLKLLREFEGHYTFAGEVPKDAIHSWFKKSDVFVFPSLSDSWGLAVTEAMACGLPVICTERTGAPVRDGIDGFVVPTCDVGALRDKIRFFYGSPHARRQMGSRGRDRILGAYTWEHYRTRVGDAYSAILSNGVATPGTCPEG